MASRASPLSSIWSGALGFRGRRSFVAWMVAGGLAYYLYVVPDKQRAEEQQRVREQAKRWAEEAAAAAAADKQ
ncbi:hypothetical protein CHLNCDRAFT_138591 [Chlorella variabilis]|uniref:Uncharacterized protein n=1 Tax=Chlorella variabilis TaxID=554065 RepID=E1ZNC4_CHLVA|nr:hypothetical protein CHLNCDRAFT_138591 [Chlorella variabilis]EFN52582.1 hypothetical protein CHLNCDRAFT_138591 [Chlorella variabilis]|eukprot:XP_005844684.1 hypothetical protein CHLNCDRAFT_138591 [Chlorella variabilis]